MTDHSYSQKSRVESLPVSPSLKQSLELTNSSPKAPHIGFRVLVISLYAIFIGALAAGAAYLFTLLIEWITNIFFFGMFSAQPASIVDHSLGLFVIFIPVAGALIIGFMARYGSAAIRGHGIPEAMERVLLHESKIPMRLLFLKPLSAAISIGTGGPFGAEGPIIATGGALGSLWGQLAKITEGERKTLLAAGAAAGLAATFGSPIAAVLLAIELLLFEYRARSIIPVALAAITAQALRSISLGSQAVFPMEEVIQPQSGSLFIYSMIGMVIGFASVGLTRLVHWLEDCFEKLPIHWMWHPALGALIVGIVGYFDPRVFGVGYHYIEQTLSGNIVGQALFTLGLMKFITWTVYVASGTSGGTLAPMFIIGGALGTALGFLAETFFPGIGMDHRIAALVGMTAIFTGASRAFLASVLLAIETTHQPLALIPVFTGCTTSYLVSCLMMPTSIMTEKMTRRGVHVPEGFEADLMSQIIVRDHASFPAIVLQENQTIESVRQWLDSNTPGSTYSCYPVVNEQGKIRGIISRKEIGKKEINAVQTLATLIHRLPITIDENAHLRTALELMARHDVGRLTVIRQSQQEKVIGILTRSDIVKAYSFHLKKNSRSHRSFKVRTSQSKNK